MIINGKELKEMYPDFDEECYQPCGIDLKVGKIFEFLNTTDIGLYNNEKHLPALMELIPQKSASGLLLYFLEPDKNYAITVDKPIKIPDDVMQLYFPRSSLLRCNVDLSTAVGDPSYNGVLQFKIRNNNKVPFILGQGERFAQLVCFETKEKGNYEGDYQEEVEE